MAFDWNDYARLAEELRTRKDEASLRTAISNHLVDATFDIGRNLLAYLEQCQKRERV